MSGQRLLLCVFGEELSGFDMLWASAACAFEIPERPKQLSKAADTCNRCSQATKAPVLFKGGTLPHYLVRGPQNVTQKPLGAAPPPTKHVPHKKVTLFRGELELPTSHVQHLVLKKTGCTRILVCSLNKGGSNLTLFIRHDLFGTH